MIGIATLLYAVPIALALVHQAMAIVLLTVAVLQAARLQRNAGAVASVAGLVAPVRS
jgi:cytochrome c oxidase assembly protein subunit 15